MKYTLLSCCVMIVATTRAQQIPSISPAPGRYKCLDETTVMPFRETVFWEEDFSDGIPSGWINGDAGEVAYWEYRGLSTDPNNETGTRGSCLPEGTVGAPIQSTTWGNGFVIFDSNWWDDPIGPCGNQGSGPAPSPHDAWLELPPFDFSDHPKLALIFQQYAKNYQANMSVEVSINNAPWIEVFTNDLIINQSTPLTDEVRVNLSNSAGGESNSRIRFHFSGSYYFWMLDDFSLVDLDDNNMYNGYSTYGDYDFYAPENPTGFEWLEYSQYPDEMPPQLRFTTTAENFGALIQTGVGLHVEVTNENTATEIHDGTSSETFNVAPGAQLELKAGNFQMPQTVANYSVRFEVTQNEEEEAPEDNNDTLHFKITDVVYARDKGPAQGVFIPIEEYNDHAYEAGNIFVITKNGISAHSVSVGLSVGTVTPATVYAAIYEFDLETEVSATLLGTTPSVEITAEDLNNFGDEHLITLEFGSPIPLTNGHAYLVVAGSEDGPNHVLYSMSGNSPEFSSWVWFDTNEWFYLSEMPIVRLNIGPLVDNVQETSTFNSGTLLCFPSPANNEVTLSYPMNHSEALSYEVFDATGKKIISGQTFSHSGKNALMIASENFPNGVYSVRLYGVATLMKGKFCIHH